MRLLRFPRLPFVAVAAIAAVPLPGLVPLQADEPRDPIKVNSVWQGKCEQPDLGVRGRDVVSDAGERPGQGTGEGGCQRDGDLQ